MPEFLNLLPPDEARGILLSSIRAPIHDFEKIEATNSLDRICMEDIFAPHPLPEFRRSSVDGYAVKAQNTYGASDSQPVYLNLIGEISMGNEARLELSTGQCALIHTGGMLPKGADAVVMVEYTQSSRSTEIELSRAVAEDENVIGIGEDVAEGQLILNKGTRIRAAEIGGLMALGIFSLRVAKRVMVGLISSGDEIVEPSLDTKPGQVRDVNSYTLAALIIHCGGTPRLYGIVPDNYDVLKRVAATALDECDMVVITAGSSASIRDMTAQVIDSLGKPGVLVHGINTRPGKPTIFGVSNGKAVIGLPGNPVSALVNGYLFVVPVITKLTGEKTRPQGTITASLTINLPSQAGREDWWPVRLKELSNTGIFPRARGVYESNAVIRPTYSAEPIFGKSNLIFNLAAADGLVCIPADSTGLNAGAEVDVILI